MTEYYPRNARVVLAFEHQHNFSYYQAKREKPQGHLNSCSKNMSQYPTSVLENFFILINKPVKTTQLTSD